MNEGDIIWSFLQGVHLLLGDQGLLYRPLDQTLQSYLHHHGHQQGQVGQGGSSQWRIHNPHDHLHVHTIPPKDQQYSVLFTCLQVNLVWD